MLLQLSVALVNLECS